MADLPSLSNTVPQVRAPTPGVSPGQVAAPYNELASTLDTAAKEAGEIAKPLARVAGVQAVTRDADGNLQVQRLPIIGPAADDFRNAVQWSALAQSSGEARRKDLELSREYANDPQGYLNAADAFKKKYVDNITKAVGPEVGLKLATVIDGTTTQQYSSLLAQQQATIKRNFDHDTAAVIKDAKVDLDNLIETGGMDSAAGRKQANDLMNRIIGSYHERVNNPVLAAPRGEAELAIKKLDQDIGGAMFAARVKKTLDDNPDDGISKAESLIDENFKDGSISASQRVANRDRGQEAIKTFAQDRVRAASVATKQQKAYDDAFENKVMVSTTEGATPISETDIKKDPLASPAAKIKMLGFLKREGMPEPLARVSHETMVRLMQRVRANDDTRLTRDDEIFKELFAGNLNKADFNFVRNEFVGMKTPEGETIARDRTEFFRRFAPSIDAGMIGSQHSALGAQRMYEFEVSARRQEAILRDKKLDPHLAYDPDSEYYLGRQIANKRASLVDIQNYDKEMAKADKEREKNRNLTGPGKDVISTTIQDIPAGMSPAEAMRQYKSGTKIRLPDGRVGTVP